MDSKEENQTVESDVCPLQIENLTKTYKGENKQRITALDGVSFHLKKGEIFGYIGENGAGKTTTFKAVMSMIKPDSGSIKIFDIPSENFRSRTNVGYVPEEPGFLKFLKGRDMLRVAAELAGVSKKDLTHEIDRVIEETSLGVYAERRIKTYSRGQRQRLAIAQALLSWPRLLLLDEPSAGLDPVGIQWLIDLLLRLRNKGVTIIFSSHQLTDVEKVADRVGVLKDGRFIKEENVEDILKKMSLEEFFMREIGY